VSLKVSRNVLKTFQTQLDDLEDSPKDTLNLREIIAESFESIQQARQRKYSWQQIADLLQQAVQDSGDSISISASTVRQYFFDIAKVKGKSTRKKSSPSTDNKSVKSKQASEISTASIAEPTSLSHQDHNEETLAPTEETPLQTLVTESESTSSTQPRKFNRNRVTFDS
jgi:hypothetical protein